MWYKFWFRSGLFGNEVARVLGGGLVPGIVFCFMEYGLVIFFVLITGWSSCLRQSDYIQKLNSLIDC